MENKRFGIKKKGLGGKGIALVRQKKSSRQAHSMFQMNAHKKI